MSDDDSSEKSHEPSQKKLDDARKKGEIAKSTDLITAATYAGVLVTLLAFGATPFTSAGTVLQGLLDQADTLSEVALAGSPQPLLSGVLSKVGTSLAVWFVVPMIFATICILAQQAFVFAPDKIKPKLSRISVIQGMKNKFGRQGLFEFCKSFVKLLLFGGVLSAYLFVQSERIVATVALSPGLVTAELGKMLTELVAIAFCISIILGGIDFVWQRSEHLRKNRMSRKEMLDEMKSSEGDPEMKQKRRQKGIDIAMNQMIQDVPDASVIIVNPTHYAVALRWSGERGTAPICLAKGTDEIAARIREVATDHGIPIHSDPPTARAIHATTEIGAEVAPDQYQAVAAAIRFAEDMRRRMKGRL